MRSFLNGKKTGLNLWMALVASFLTAGLLGWQLGGAGHGAATATGVAEPLPELTLKKTADAARAPLSSVAAPLAIDRSGREPLAQAPRQKQPAEGHKPAAESSGEAAVAQEQIIPVDPAQPANWMRAGDGYVSVQGYVPASGGRGMVLDVLFTAASGAYGAGEAASAGSQTSMTAALPSPETEYRPTTGLTYEEQLFRSKWGWGAYAVAQREAQWKP